MSKSNYRYVCAGVLTIQLFCCFPAQKSLTPPSGLACREIESGSIYIGTNFPSVNPAVKTRFERAVSLAVDDINRTGIRMPNNAPPARLGVISCDTSGDRDIALSNLSELQAKPEVVGHLGAALSSIVLGDSPDHTDGTCLSARQNELVSITPSATNANITTLQDDNYCYRTCADDSLQGAVQYNVLQKLGCDHTLYASDITSDYGRGLMCDVAVAHENNPDIKKACLTTGLDENNSALFQVNGFTAVAYETDCTLAARAAEELQNQLTLMDNNQTLCFASSFFTKDLAQITHAIIDTPVLKEAITLNRLKFLISDGSYSKEYIQRLPPSVTDLLGTNGRLHATKAGCTQDTSTFEQTYTEAFSLPPESFEHSVYDAVMLFAIAMSMTDLHVPQTREESFEYRRRIQQLLQNKRLQKRDENDCHITVSFTGESSLDPQAIAKGWNGVSNVIDFVMENPGNCTALTPHDWMPLQSVDYEGASGLLEFSAFGDVESKFYIGELSGTQFVESTLWRTGETNSIVNQTGCRAPNELANQSTTPAVNPGANP